MALSSSSMVHVSPSLLFPLSKEQAGIVDRPWLADTDSNAVPWRHVAGSCPPGVATCAMQLPGSSLQPMRLEGQAEETAQRKFNSSRSRSSNNISGSSSSSRKSREREGWTRVRSSREESLPRQRRDTATSAAASADNALNVSFLEHGLSFATRTNDERAQTGGEPGYGGSRQQQISRVWQKQTEPGQNSSPWRQRQAEVWHRRGEFRPDKFEANGRSRPPLDSRESTFGMSTKRSLPGPGSATKQVQEPGQLSGSFQRVLSLVHPARRKRDGLTVSQILSKHGAELTKREVEEVIAVLKSRKDAKGVLQALRWVKRQPWFRPNVKLYNGIMGFLTKAGAPESAVLLFQEMVLDKIQPNQFSYTALINALGGTKQYDDALSVFEYMKAATDAEVRPNTVTCNVLMKALCQGRRFAAVAQLFQDMYHGTEGLDSNCSPSIVTYNTLLDALCQENHLDAAFNLLRDLASGKLDFPPSLHSNPSAPGAHPHGLDAPGAPKPDPFMNLTAPLNSGSSTGEPVGGSTLALSVEPQAPETAVSELPSGGAPPRAQKSQLFRETAGVEGEGGAFVEGSYFGGKGADKGVQFGGSNLSVQPRASLQPGVGAGPRNVVCLGLTAAPVMRPNTVTYNTLIDACGKAGKIEMAEHLVAMMEEGAGWHAAPATAAAGPAPAEASPDSGRMSAVGLSQQRLERQGGGGLRHQVSQDPTRHPPIPLVNDRYKRQDPGQTSQGPGQSHLEQGSRSFERAQTDCAAAPNAQALSSSGAPRVASGGAGLALGGAGGSWRPRAAGTEAGPVWTGDAPGMGAGAAGGGVWVRPGGRASGDASGVPKAGPSRDARGAVGRRGELRGGRGQKAWDVSQGIAPDAFTYTALLDAYGREGEVEKAERIMEHMQARGISPDVHAFTALLSVYNRAGMPECVPGVLSRMAQAGLEPNEVTYLMALDTYGKAGQHRSAEATMQRMLEAGVRPSVLTWSALIDAYGRAGEWKLAAATFRRMQDEGRCVPTSVTYAALLSACARCPSWEDALLILYALQQSGREVEMALCQLLMTDGVNGEDVFVQASAVVLAFQMSQPKELTRSLFNNLADALWSFGFRARAARVVQLARSHAVYPEDRVSFGTGQQPKRSSGRGQGGGKRVLGSWGWEGWGRGQEG